MEKELAYAKIVSGLDLGPLRVELDEIEPPAERMRISPSSGREIACRS